VEQLILLPVLNPSATRYFTRSQPGKLLAKSSHLAWRGMLQCYPRLLYSSGLKVQDYPSVVSPWWCFCYQRSQAQDSADWFAAHGVQLKLPSRMDGCFRSPIIQRQSWITDREGSFTVWRQKSHGAAVERVSRNQLGLFRRNGEIFQCVPVYSSPPVSSWRLVKLQS